MNPKRYENCDDWRNFGFGIKSLTNISEEEKLEIFEYFSRKCSDKYNKKIKCADFFNGLGEPADIRSGVKPITMGTIIYWLKEDNPDYIKLYLIKVLKVMPLSKGDNNNNFVDTQNHNIRLG